MTPVKVAIVDDSSICRQRLRTILEADGSLNVALCLECGEGVAEALKQAKPDILITDLTMPGVDGLAVLESVMRECPLPTIVVSSGGVEATTAFDATRLGALGVMAKPAFGDREAEAALREAARTLARVPVVRHPGRKQQKPRDERSVQAAKWTGVRPTVVGIGASAGGPLAILELLEALSVENAPAVLVAQHMARGHAAAFAEFLRRRTRFEIVLCEGAVSLRPGRVLVPADGLDLIITGSDRALASESNRSLSPSVDALLASLARHLGSTGAGVVLSGIGEDGAQGLAMLRESGGLALVQCEGSAAVYGMPRVAARSAHFQLAPAEIGHLLARGGVVRRRAVR